MVTELEPARSLELTVSKRMDALLKLLVIEGYMTPAATYQIQKLILLETATPQEKEEIATVAQVLIDHRSEGFSSNDVCRCGWAIPGKDVGDGVIRPDQIAHVDHQAGKIIEALRELTRKE